MNKVSGAICLVVGGLLLYWGYNMSQGASSQINDFFNGTPGDKPMLFYIAGVILVLTSIGQLAWKKK
jgi:hypothetical protein